MTPQHGNVLFAVIEPKRVRGSSIAASIAVHVVLLLTFAAIPLFLIEPVKIPRYEMTLLTAPDEPHVVQPVRLEAPQIKTPKLKPATVATMKTPPVMVESQPVREIRLPEVTETKPATPLAPEQPRLQPAVSEPPVPVETKPTKQVQTGGFGDVNAVHPEGRPANVWSVASLSSFDLPAGDGSRNGKPRQRAVVGSGFDGNGEAASSGLTTRSTAAVSTGTFASVQTASAQAPRRTAKPIEVPVEILYKPRPEYSEDARRMRIEGEVALRILFAASGQTRVLGVVRGLGYGLDEKAMHAAERIQFKPATYDGAPVDSTAIVRIAFQMAY